MSLVPFKRELRVGLEGGDVRALQRALRAAECRTIDPTGEFRQVTRRNVVLFQRRHGIKVAQGVVKSNTWAALQPYFDAYSHYLVNHTHIAPSASTKIDHFVKAAWAYYAARPLRYVQERPMRNTFDLPYIDRYLDCSEYVYVCAKNADLPDPSGFGYSGYGNTFSFLDHMQATHMPERGDLVFYDDPSHVAIIVGSVRKYGRMVLSNGSDLGPRYLQESYRNPVAYRTFRS